MGSRAPKRLRNVGPSQSIAPLATILDRAPLRLTALPSGCALRSSPLCFAVPPKKHADSPLRSWKRPRLLLGAPVKRRGRRRQRNVQQHNFDRLLGSDAVSRSTRNNTAMALLSLANLCITGPAPRVLLYRARFEEGGQRRPPSDEVCGAERRLDRGHAVTKRLTHATPGSRFMPVFMPPMRIAH